jgi:DNA polymerase III sliding clamp (beta) subunit (PCNA family)
MKIDKDYRVEKAVSTDSHRENLQNIWITQHHAFATNGTMLAAVPVTSEKADTPGWLTPEALKLARRAMKGSDTISICLNGQMILPGGVTLPRPTENRFPRIFQLFRRAFAGRKIRIGINAAQLKDLSDAIGQEEITLENGSEDEALVVRPIRVSNSAVGLLMPIRLKGKN